MLDVDWFVNPSHRDSISQFSCAIPLLLRREFDELARGCKPTEPIPFPMEKRHASLWHELHRRENTRTTALTNPKPSLMAQRPPSGCSARPRSPATAVWFLPAAALLLVLILRWPHMGSYPPVSPRNQPFQTFHPVCCLLKKKILRLISPFFLGFAPRRRLQLRLRAGPARGAVREDGAGPRRARRGVPPGRRDVAVAHAEGTLRHRGRRSRRAQAQGAAFSPPAQLPCSAAHVGWRVLLFCVAELKCARQAADPPVRANVLYLDPEFAVVISWVMMNFAWIRWQLAILFLVAELKIYFFLCKREKNKFNSHL